MSASTFSPQPTCSTRRSLRRWLAPVLMVEDPAVFPASLPSAKTCLHPCQHAQHRAALRAQGLEVIYFGLESGHSIRSAVAAAAADLSATQFSTFAISDRGLARVRKHGGGCRHCLESRPQSAFLGSKGFRSISRAEWHAAYGPFLPAQHRLRILLNHQGRPEGGKWSYDSENRKKIRKG